MGKKSSWPRPSLAVSEEDAATVNMYYAQSSLRGAAALLCALPLIAVYLFARDTAEPIINRFIVWPLNIVLGDEYTPLREIVSGATCTLALLLPSLLCGALFGRIFRRMTVGLALLATLGLGLHFMLPSRDPNHWFGWLEYYSYAFLAASFVVFSVLAAKRYRRRLAKGQQPGWRGQAMIASLITMIVAASAWLHFYYPLLGTVIRGKGFEGIIVSTYFADPRGNARWWDVRDSDMKKLESRLHSFVESNRAELGPSIGNELASFRRWYIPYRSPEGEKRVDVALMHGSRVSRAQWLHRFFGTSGSGDLFCDATYIPDENRFVNFRCNPD